ncbi:type 1 glutamine amidotransferase [Dermacoccaceae bacterium W4C1]
MANPQVLIVQNSAGSSPGRLPQWCADAGAEVTLVRAYDGQPVPREPQGHDAVVLLGGGLMPDADEDHPWLVDERALVRACVARSTPLLGICLGGQLMALTFGGQVRAAYGTPEHGLVDLSLRPDAAADPLLSALPDGAPAMEHHQDQITALPEQATWLASTEACPNQAFRIGDRAWGLQWHPEAEATRVESWDPAETRALGLDHDELVRIGREREQEVEHLWSAFFGRFLQLAAAG